MIHNIKTGDTVYDKDGCKGVRLNESGGSEYVQLSLGPGGAIPEHSLPLAVSFYVLKGNGICTVSGTSVSATEGDMLECPPGALRGWRNESSELLEILVIKRSINN